MEEHWKYVGLFFYNNFVRLEKYPIFAKNKRQIIMPEIFRAYGFVFMFFSLEHEPVHVHVIGKGGDAKFVWNGSFFELIEKHNIKAGDLRNIKKMIDDNSDIIIRSWNLYFKGDDKDKENMV